MITSVFVDIYHTYVSIVDATNRLFITSTSDGGAAFTQPGPDHPSPRVIKVNAAGEFQWFSQVAADSSGDVHQTGAIVEDTTETGGPYLYVGGYKYSGTASSSFIIKYQSASGTYIKSHVISVGYSTYLQSLLVDSSGVLVFAGDYYVTSAGSTRTAWFGSVDKSTLVPNNRGPDFSVTAYRMIEDGACYVLCGDWVSHYGCIVLVNKSDWTTKWVNCYSTIYGPHMLALLALGSEICIEEPRFKVLAHTLRDMPDWTIQYEKHIYTPINHIRHISLSFPVSCISQHSSAPSSPPSPCRNLRRRGTQRSRWL